MNDSLEDLEQRLKLFRPRGETRLVEQVLRDLGRRAGDDPILRQRLRAQPHKVLAEAGIACSPDLRIEVHEDGGDARHLVLPVTPSQDGEDSPELGRLLDRVHSDPGFGEQLLRHPRRTIESELGMTLPPGFQVLVHANSVRCQHLILAVEQGELSDLELEMVAGGLHWPFGPGKPPPVTPPNP